MQRSVLYTLFIVVLLTTEFFYIEVGGGVARIYHFLAVLVVLFLIGSAGNLFRSGVFWVLLGFLAVNILAAFLSDNPSAAFASLSSFVANVAVAIAVALILLGLKLPLESMKNIIVVVTVISIFWGIVQILAFSSGVLLALSPEQKSQILQGFGPGFRTEANTFGKYMILPFFMLLPVYLKSPKSRKIRLAYTIIIMGILMNFTRTALIGMMIALVFVFFWYALRRQLVHVFPRSAKVAVSVAMGVTLIVTGAVQVSGYAKYKIENFFNKEEVFEGSSSVYRLASMEKVLHVTFQSPKRTVIGNGWGQTYVMLRGIRVQAGGGDWVSILGFSGILGLFFYLVFSAAAFITLVRAAGDKKDRERAMFAEGLLFAFVGIFVTGQISGYLIAPEYWLLIGICIYLGATGRKKVTKARIS